MSKKIITISREFGSGGRYLGEKVAQRLGIKYYDKELIAKVAKETGFSEKYVEEQGEHSPNKGFFAYAFVGRDSQGASMGDYMHAAQTKIILEAADEGPCVIIGRCADDILKDRKDCLNVFISGNMTEKIERITKLYNVSEEEARKRMKDMDKKRSTHYNYYTDRKWGDVRNYTLALNSSEIGYEKCIDIICDLASE